MRGSRGGQDASGTGQITQNIIVVQRGAELGASETFCSLRVGRRCEEW